MVRPNSCPHINAFRLSVYQVRVRHFVWNTPSACAVLSALHRPVQIRPPEQPSRKTCWMAVSVDNNHRKNQMCRWALDMRAWLFAGSELTGQQAALVISVVQSVKSHGDDSWARRTLLNRKSIDKRGGRVVPAPRAWLAG